MKLNSLSPLESLEPLKALKPMRTERVFILNNVSDVKLISLGVRLLYQCSIDVDSGTYDADLIDRRIFWANKLLKAIDNPNELYFMSDVKAICKALKIKNPLKN